MSIWSKPSSCQQLSCTSTKETGVYTSPRQQGAGIVDTAAAISTGLYVTGDNQYPSVSLGNVQISFTFDVTVHNMRIRTGR